LNSEKIIKILRDKNATLPCPACGHDGFTLLDGDFIQEFIVWGESPLGPLGVRPGPSRRSLNYIVLVCDNCGYIRQHAKKPLGIPTRKI
jgi:predicted nucleic-acid-binding Zn-ribbon protein